MVFGKRVSKINIKHFWSMSRELASSDFMRKFLRSVCGIHGGKAAFGFQPKEIGNKSIRSGAAMALFLADHSPANIMILGRWSSDAFLVCIRPQVVEWTNNMSEDMIGLDSYWDLAKPFNLTNEDPPTARRQSSHHGQASLASFPIFHLLH